MATTHGELLSWLGWLDAVRGMEGKIRRMFKALDGVLEKVINDHRCRRQAGQQTGGDEGGDHHARDMVTIHQPVCGSCCSRL